MGIRATSLVRVLPVAGWCAIGAPVHAQWTAIRLHNPASFNSSVGMAAAGDWQGGLFVTGQAKPVLWHSSSSSWVNLAPGSGDHGGVVGMHADRQVGRFNGHASLWSGTPESRVDLHPAWASLSEAPAVWENEQVGWAGTTVERAALWHGSVASYVDLHPAGAVHSRANAVAGGQQGGRVEFPFPGGGTIAHAALWSGTAASFVNLNPPGATSEIGGMWPGQQVGWAILPGTVLHAGMWSGTPESFVDLHPSGILSMSQAYATCGSAQVGYVGHDAAIWFGSAQSVVRLDDFLPPGQYFQSEALAVTFHNGLYYVAGRATSTAGVSEAWLWVGIPAPGGAGALICFGVYAVLRRRR